MATQADLAVRVLRKIRRLGTNQTPQPEDMEIVLEKLRAVHVSLAKDERIRWTINTLPEAAEEPYVFMASFLSAPEFGVGIDQAVWTWGEREITSLINVRESGDPTRMEYF